MTRRVSTVLLLSIASMAWCVPAAHTPVYRPALLPPVPWGVPLAGGAIRVLCAGPSAAIADAAQLAQRIEIDYDTAAIPPVPGADTWPILEERLHDTYDVLIFGRFDFAQMPDTLWETVARKVTEGTGLVLAYPPSTLPAPLQALIDALPRAEDASSITRGIGAAMTPEWPSNLDFVSARHGEKSRIAVLDYPGTPPFTHMLVPPLMDPGHAREDYLDVYLSLVAKAVRWAAGRDPATWIDKVESGDLQGPADDEIPPDLPDEFVQQMRDAALPPVYHTYVVRFNAPLPKRFRVQAQIREPNRPLRLFYPRLPRLSKGDEACRIDLPVGPGQYLLDLWILDKKAVVEWHTEAVQVPGVPTISDVSYSKGFLMRNDALTVSLNVRAQMASSVQTGQQHPCSVYVRAVDSLGRLVAEGQTVAPQGGERVEVSLAFADLIANLVKIEVFAAEVTTPHFTSWDLSRAAYTSLYVPVRAPGPDAGFSLVADMPAISEYNARACLRSLIPAGFDAVHAPATDDARYHLAAMNLMPIPEVACYVPESVEAPGIRKPCLTDPLFREAEDGRIRERAAPFWAVGSAIYSLGKGNRLAEAGADVCLSPTCIERFQAGERERYVSLDALNRTWGAAFGQWEDVVPSVRDAVRGSERYAPWLDWRLHMDSVLLETHERAEAAVRAVDAGACAGPVLLDAAGPESGVDYWAMGASLSAMVIGPDKAAMETVRSARKTSAYFGIRLGDLPDTATARWYPWNAALHGANALWMDMADIDAANPRLSALTDAVAPLRMGLGIVFKNALRPGASIAVVCSQASRYLHAIVPELPDTASSMTACMQALDSLAYAYDVVPDTRLAPETLKPYRVLVLPSVHALSTAAMQALRAFTEHGGRILADIVPGTYDEHGTLRTAPDTGFQTPLAPFTPNDMEVPLKEAGVERIADATLGGAGTLDGTCYHFNYGAAHLYALLRAPDAPEPHMAKCSLAIPGDGTMYDVLQGRRMTHRKRIETKLPPGGVFLASLLPYTVTGIRIETLDTVVLGHRLPIHVTVETDGKPASHHVIHVTIQRGQIQPLAYYARDIECPAGSGSTYIPLAADEQLGSYSVAARDVLTGVTAQAIVHVVPKSKP